MEVLAVNYPKTSKDEEYVQKLVKLYDSELA